MENKDILYLSVCNALLYLEETQYLIIEDRGVFRSTCPTKYSESQLSVDSISIFSFYERNPPENSRMNSKLLGSI